MPAAVGTTVREFPYADIDALRDMFRSAGDDVAAVMMSPALKDAPPSGYLAAVRDLCHQNGALLVFDEVVTGFRFSLGGAQEYFGVTPDLACFAKAMANGMPLACFCGRADVMAIAANLKITATYGGEALSLAAADACLQEYRNNDVIAHIWRIGRRLIDGTNAAAADLGCPARRAGFPPLSYLEFRGETEEESSVMRSYFIRGASARGVLFHQGGLSYVCYSHTDADVDVTLTVQRELFAEIEARRRAGTLAEV